MSFIDTDDPFSIAAKRIRSSVIRSTPEPQLPIQGKQQPTTYIIEPDLMESQTGKMNLPNDVAFDDAGFAYNTVTGNPVQVVRRPNVLPITKTPDGFTPVMPKVLDIVGNVMGNVGGLAGGKVAANAGELVLGSGVVRTMRNPNKIQIENLINKSEHQELRGLIDDSGVHVWDASKSTHHDTAKELGINYDINNRIHITKPQDEKGFYTLDFDDKWRNPELVKSNPNFVRLLNQDNILVNEPGQGLISGKDFLKLYSDTRPQVANVVGHALEKQNQPFFSALERTVDNAKIGKADANQWLGYLKNQPGVKAEEINTVLRDLPEGQITKQQLNGIVKQNKIELKEKVLGSDTKHIDVKLDELQPLVNKMIQENNKLGFDSIGQARSAIRTDNPANWEFNNSKDLALAIEYHKLYQSKLDQIPTKYHDYQLPGGSNYQEMLLTLPDKQKRLYEWEYFDPKTQTSKQFKTEAEAKAAAPEGAIVGPKETQTLNESYKSSHWDEPNILAHVRYNDRNIPDVGKSLHLEEIQSDWHQAGRKQGYKGESNLDKFNELDKQLQEARADLGQAAIDSSQNSIGMSWAKFLQTKPTQEAKDAALAKIAEYRKTDARYLDKEAKVKELEEARARANPVGKVPDAPFKKNWDELAFKRMLHKAATEGYDSISWTPGEAQAARYDLSKQVSKVILNNPVWHGENDIRGHLIATSKANGNDIISKPVSSFKEIEDLIGKEAAEKLVNKPSSMQGRDHILDGDGLKVGGEGMKSFYDKMLVDKANALAKKYGAKVESREIINPEEYKAWLELNEGQKTEVGDRSKAFHKIHYLPITKELREKAKAGFPLFSSIPITVPVSHNPFTEENKKYRLVPVPYNPFN